MKVNQLMTKNVRHCSPGDTCADAATLMGELNVGAIPVVEGERVVGIVTDRDIVLRAVARGGAGPQTRIGDVMTRDVISCSPATSARECSDMMAQKQIRRIPVVENGRLVGIVALGDLATVDIHVNEAGDALSGISEPARPGAH